MGNTQAHKHTLACTHTRNPNQTALQGVHTGLVLFFYFLLLFLTIEMLFPCTNLLNCLSLEKKNAKMAVFLSAP